LTDIVGKSRRSEMMSGIRAKDTRPEIIVRKALHSAGFRFRLHKKIGGTRPDIVLKKWNLCIFVHGCFWHRHAGCKFATTPKTNRCFWLNKLSKNRLRDYRNYEELNASGWRTGVVWECAVHTNSNLAREIVELVRSEGNWQIPM